MRVAALWFPDWPVHAARLAGDVDGEQLSEPIAIAARHRVVVCSAQARHGGVRRGMKVRAAQAVCPQLTVCEADPDRDGRMFSSLAAGFDDVAASVEVLRPGLVLVDLASAAKFHGSEDTVLEMLIDTAARKGIDAQAGAADEIATAVLAARSGVIVDKSSDFLATQPIGVLVAEISFGIDSDVVRSLSQLGVQTLGDLAALPSTAVSTRFGQAGVVCHRIARGAPDRRVAPELPTTDWAVGITPEEPIERVDAAAFAARQLAAALHEKLKKMGQTCVRLKVVAELDDETRLERVWRTREALTESATADRVRWQLDGWLTGGGAGAIVSLVLEPLELAAPEAVGQLWRDGSSSDGVRRVAERVQSTLGIEAVLQPALVGGRGVDERVALVPFGDHAPEVIDAPWPGAIPKPLPARLGGGVAHPASRIVMVDETGQRIQVTAEAVLSSRPFALKWGDSYYAVTGWAGPWPVDAGWWGPSPQRVARLQVVATRGGNRHDRKNRQYAWLLQWTNQQWRIEALYS
ncbi:Y-family DNA polymerase [Corynebacterium cystitidis]|uniref:Protein ImuB n=1 Tax=Corynebacterium cystitidis DSM 20524 TaxID=1121357 RepID=A0A1H9QWX2_9CORY|nr:DNA polymerase Y family protein [Corynebacterium cystitidis]WJY81630.1 DNA polymerase IV [Corynebacterium cystitidis DSM 20524]SER64972.1 protein ImuB [Corynebacterium cystitidis DSM 20524]SNV85530.1 DNA polymerase involved in DNA repair [Corynebacterium cystitidis]